MLISTYSPLLWRLSIRFDSCSPKTAPMKKSLSAFTCSANYPMRPLLCKTLRFALSWAWMLTFVHTMPDKVSLYTDSSTALPLKAEGCSPVFPGCLRWVTVGFSLQLVQVFLLPLSLLPVAPLIELCLHLMGNDSLGHVPPWGVGCGPSVFQDLFNQQMPTILQFYSHLLLLTLQGSSLGALSGALLFFFGTRWSVKLAHLLTCAQWL